MLSAMVESKESSTPRDISAFFVTFLGILLRVIVIACIRARRIVVPGWGFAFAFSAVVTTSVAPR
jgi:hypothetical protein